MLTGCRGRITRRSTRGGQGKPPCPPEGAGARRGAGAARGGRKGRSGPRATQGRPHPRGRVPPQAHPTLCPGGRAYLYLGPSTAVRQGNPCNTAVARVHGERVGLLSMTTNAHAESPQEDDPGWSCIDAGNRVCGPLSDDWGHTPGCYDDGGVIVALWPCEAWKPSDGHRHADGTVTR